MATWIDPVTADAFAAPDASDPFALPDAITSPPPDVNSGSIWGAVNNWFLGLDRSMKAAGIPTSDQVLHGVGDTMTNADQAIEHGGQAIGEGLGTFGAGIGNAGANVATGIVSQVAPYALAAGLVFIALDMRRAR